MLWQQGRETIVFNIISRSSSRAALLSLFTGQHCFIQSIDSSAVKPEAHEAKQHNNTPGKHKTVHTDPTRLCLFLHTSRILSVSLALVLNVQCFPLRGSISVPAELKLYSDIAVSERTTKKICEHQQSQAVSHPDLTCAARCGSVWHDTYSTFTIKI